MSTLSFKQPLWIGISIIVFFALVLSACGPASSPGASRGAATPAENQEMLSQSSTPAPTENPANTQLEYSNQNFGFSLHYPKGYVVQQTFAHEIIFLAPQGTPGHRERAFLEVERVLDQDAGWFADQMKQENANLAGLHIYSSMSVIDGQQAYILGGMPGQDSNRQVFIVYKGLLYHLTFVPDDPQTGEAYQQMETLYSAVMNSLRIRPERRDVPPVTGFRNMVYQIERAGEARSEEAITRLPGDEFTTVIVNGWGLEGADGAVLIIARRMDGSLFWSGMYMEQGTSAP